MTEVDKYISTFPDHVQMILNKIRDIIMEAAPEVTESISYGMPAYKTNKKPLVYFAGYLNYIGFYATPSGHEKFSKELAEYRQGKGSVRFPLDKPIPYGLIKKIVEFRVHENELKVRKV